MVYVKGFVTTQPATVGGMCIPVHLLSTLQVDRPTPELIEVWGVCTLQAEWALSLSSPWIVSSCFTKAFWGLGLGESSRYQAQSLEERYEQSSPFCSVSRYPSTGVFPSSTARQDPPDRSLVTQRDVISHRERLREEAAMVTHFGRYSLRISKLHF